MTDKLWIFKRDESHVANKSHMPNEFKMETMEIYLSKWIYSVIKYVVDKWIKQRKSFDEIYTKNQIIWK